MGLPLVFLDFVALRAVSLRAELPGFSFVKRKVRAEHTSSGSSVRGRSTATCCDVLEGGRLGV
jgi:hypothetical protein